MIAAGGVEPRPTLAFVGAGRAGSALATAAREAGYTVTAIASRRHDRAVALAAAVGARAVDTPLQALRLADITLLTVPDAAITRLAASVAASGVALRGRGVVHCSALRGREALAPLRQTAAIVGAVHPLQALAGRRSASLLRGATFVIDADVALQPQLEQLVADLGGHRLDLTGVDRRLYHAAAVLAGNAPLALLAAAADLLADAGVERRAAERALTALLAGAAENARNQGIPAALTGPMVRGDTATVDAHLDALRDRPATAALYRTLAEATARVVAAPAGAAASARRRRHAA